MNATLPAASIAEGSRPVRRPWSVSPAPASPPSERIDPDRIGDVLELFRAEIGDCEIEPALHLTIGVLGQADRAGRGDPLRACAMILTPSPIRSPSGLLRPRRQGGCLRGTRCGAAQACTPALRSMRARFCIPQPRSAQHLQRCETRWMMPSPAQFDDAAVMGGDGRIDQVAAQTPESRQRAILVRAREPATTDHVRDQGSLQFSWVSVILLGPRPSASLRPSCPRWARNTALSLRTGAPETPAG